MVMATLTLLVASLLLLIIGAIASLLFYKRPAVGTILGISSTTVAAVSSVILLIEHLNGAGSEMLTWYALSIGSRNIYLTLSLDIFSSVMVLIACILTMLIAIFSYEYMGIDHYKGRYWFFLQLFLAGMIGLVATADLVTLYIGWEIVGLCSYGLISHWHKNEGEQGEKCAKAGVKAFVFTRIGDIGLLLAIFLIYQSNGSFLLSRLSVPADQLDLIASLLILAAMAKSAQFPFIPWLSSPGNVDVDAMQGPTTVSALIHAATMVKAGVYLLFRMSMVLPLTESKVFVDTLLAISGVTICIAACSALVAMDIKRVLAYSTISQLGYMFFALGYAGYATLSQLDHQIIDTAFIAGIYHLYAHAIFKSLLFLGAGYLIMRHHHQRSLEDLAGSCRWSQDKVGFLTLTTGTLAIIGIPPFVGFWSKDLILHAIMEGYEANHDPSTLILASVGIFGAVLTAAYMTRFWYYLVLKQPASEKEDSSGVMAVVISVLSVIALVAAVPFISIADKFNSEYNLHASLSVLSENTYLILLLIVAIAVITTIMLVNGTAILNVPGMRLLEMVFAAGFYLEHLWQLVWHYLYKAMHAYRKLHSGNLNYNVLLSTIVAMAVMGAAIGGML